MNERVLTRNMLITLTLILCLVVIFLILGAGMALNYVLMEHYVHAISLHIETVDAATTRHILAVEAKAAQGRSKSLCHALKHLATTRKAHKLHPVFKQVYEHTQCALVTGKLHLPHPFHHVRHHHKH